MAETGVVTQVEGESVDGAQNEGESGEAEDEDESMSD